MQLLNISCVRRTHSLIWIFLIFLILMIAGCSKKDAAIASLKKDNITLTAESLTFFANKGDSKKIELLLDAGVNVDVKDSQGATALISASWGGKQDVVAYLLNAKADVNIASAAKLTALLAAVNQKQDQIAILLLENGANPNVADAIGSSPLITAAWQGNATLVRAMTEKGADVNYKRPSDGLTAIKAAQAANNLDIVQHLKSRGAIE